MSTMQSIFYDTSKLSVDQKTDILKYAKSVCSSWRIDQKNHIEMRRTPIRMSFAKVLSIFKSDIKSHFVIIHRPKIFEPEQERFEVGFSTMNLSPTYYLFIFGDLNFLDIMIEKYKLKILH